MDIYNDIYVYPVYDDIIKPRKVIMAIFSDGENYETKCYVKFKKNSIYFRLDKSKTTFFHDINMYKKSIFIYNKKGLYNMYENNDIDYHYDLMSCIWTYDNKNSFNYKKDQLKDYNFLFLEQHRKILEECISLPKKNHSEFVNELLKAQCNLDGRKKGYTMFFDHYTSGGRLRDIISNTNGLTEEQRKVFYSDQTYYIDMVGCHFRIIDFFSGNIIPKNTHPIEFIMGNVKNKDQQKKQMFHALYSTKFNYNHRFFANIKKRHGRIISLFNRNHNNFNWKIQEYESYLSCYMINMLNKDNNVLTYHYDGIMVDIKKNELINKHIDLPIYQEFTWKKLL